jgi:hypothetical protein
MSSRDLASGDGGERRWALRRLRAAVAEQSRAQDASEAAGGTPNELEAAASLRAADVEVGARQRWLKSVDDGDY